MPKTVSSILCHAAYKKHKYGEICELAWQATYPAIENNNYNKIVVWLKQFINQQKK
ncbi:14999_t:CDS:1, partial [Cetraspora pellucida]